MQQAGDAWEVVCFDLDGCLVDSSTAITTAINAALDDLGLPQQAPARLYPYIGPPLQEAFDQLLEQIGADTSLTGELIERYRKHYQVAARELTLLFAGIEPMLHALSRGARLAVVTTKAQPYADNIIRALQLNSYFQGGVFGPSLDEPGEPKQVTLARALEQLQVGDDDHARCAMVGDRAHDVEAGKAHGLHTIGVTWGTGSRAELERAGADDIVDTPAELIDLAP